MPLSDQDRQRIRDVERERMNFRKESQRNKSFWGLIAWIAGLMIVFGLIVPACNRTKRVAAPAQSGSS